MLGTTREHLKDSGAMVYVRAKTQDSQTACTETFAIAFQKTRMALII
jgi:hypothetical protein